MDLATWAQLWGPAVPIFAVFVYYIHRLIFGIFPTGFARLEKAIVSSDSKAEKRHQEVTRLLLSLEKTIDPHAKESPTKKKKPAKSVRG